MNRPIGCRFLNSIDDYMNLNHGIKIKVSDTPLYTVNHFGPLSEIAGHSLKVLDQDGQSGDCLCVSPCGTYLIDVNRLDIVERSEPPSVHELLANLEGMMGLKSK